MTHNVGSREPVLHQTGLGQHRPLWRTGGALTPGGATTDQWLPRHPKHPEPENAAARACAHLLRGGGAEWLGPCAWHDGSRAARSPVPRRPRAQALGLRRDNRRAMSGVASGIRRPQRILERLQNSGLSERDPQGARERAQQIKAQVAARAAVLGQYRFTT